MIHIKYIYIYNIIIYNIKFNGTNESSTGNRDADPDAFLLCPRQIGHYRTDDTRFDITDMLFLFGIPIVFCRASNTRGPDLTRFPDKPFTRTHTHKRV